MELEKDAVLQSPQAQVALRQEVARSGGRVEDGDVTNLLMQILEGASSRTARNGLGAGLLKFGFEAVEEERVYDLVVFSGLVKC